MTSPDFGRNARINFLRDDQSFLYIEGYKAAGDRLVESVLANSIREHDSMIFPIVFLYRQYLELEMKDLIRNGSALLNRKKQQRFTHDILRLWDECREIMEEIWKGEPTTELDLVEQYIREFSVIDPNSETFRYPRKKDGTPSLTGYRRIDIEHLSKTLNTIASLLSGANGAIAEFLQGKSDSDSYGHD